jgi:hypothetical protein
MIPRLFAVLSLVIALAGGDIATIGELETFKHKQNGLNIISRSPDQREAYSLAAIGDFDADGDDDSVIGYPSMSTNGLP